MSTIIPILIPTRNRPTSLNRVLTYFEKFYANSHIIIADGSTAPHSVENKRMATGRDIRSVEYQLFSDDLSLLDRVLSVLKNRTETFIIMGADDDYPIMETFESSVDFLNRNLDYGVAVGPSLKLNLIDPDTLTVKLDVGRELRMALPESRCIHFSKWSFPTTYALARRDLLIKRYEFLQKHFVPGFVDFTIGAIDCLFGKVAGLSDLSFVRTAHFSGSYVRPKNRLAFLDNSQSVIDLQSGLTEELLKKQTVSRERAEYLVSVMMRSRIAELCGKPAPLLKDFEYGSYYVNKSISGQLRQFHALFQHGSLERACYLDRLSFIRDGIILASQSTDNLNEPSSVQSV